jgi:uncharacterized protein YjbI with pentapeptide repeats
MMTTANPNPMPTADLFDPEALADLPLKDQLFRLILEQPDGVCRFNAWRQTTGFHVLDLSDLDFTGCNLSGINFSNCNLLNCQFEETLLHEAKLVFAILTGSFCFNTQFYQASLEEADFKNCNLTGAVLTGVDATETSFEGATLVDVQAQDGDFTLASFKNAVLRDVDFTGAILKQAQFQEATCVEYLQLETAMMDETTQWPVGFIAR